MNQKAQEYYKQGLNASAHDRWEEATRLLNEAIKEDKTLLDAYEVLSVVYERQERLDEAIDITKQLIALDSEHVMGHANLSRFYQQKGMIFEAEEEQAEAQRLSASEGGNLSEEEAKKVKEIEGKIERYRQVIELDPKDILGYFTLGSALLEAKRFREAVQILSQGMMVDSNHSSTYVVLGMSYESLGDTVRAKTTYQMGIPIAKKQGDLIPLKKMETRLKNLSK